MLQALNCMNIRERYRARRTMLDTERPSSRWVVIGAASAILFVGVGFTNTFGVFEKQYQTSLFPDVPPEQLILIGSVASSLYFILGALTGRFADAVGYTASLVLGSAMMIGSMFAASVATQFWQLFLTQGLLFGLGLAFVYMPATSVSRQYFDSSMHGLANGLVVSGGALGGCVLPYAVQKLHEKFGLPGTFRILGYLAIGILVPSVALLRPKLDCVPRRNGTLLDLTLLKNDRFLWIVSGCAIAMTGFLPRYFLIPMSAEAQGISVTYSSWLLGLMNGLSIAGRIGIGCASDRFGKSRALTVSFLLCGSGHLMFWLPGVTIARDQHAISTALFTLFVVYVGILGSGFISLFPVVIADNFGSEDLASKTGLLNTVVGLTTLAGPSMIYAVIGNGSKRKWTVGVLVAGLFMIVGGLTLTAMSQPWKRRGMGRRNMAGDAVEP